MAGFLFRRFLSFIPTLFVITLVTFILMRAAPGGPWDRDSESKQVDARTVKLLEQQYGLNKPPWRQYTSYVIGDFDDKGSFKCGAICGHLGPSYRQRGLNIEDIFFGLKDERPFIDSKFGHTLRLGLIAFVFALAAGIPLGVLSALKQNSAIDYFITFITNIGISVPSFVACFFAIVILAVGLKLIPVKQNDWYGITPFIVPAVMFGFNTMATITRLMRSTMLDVMRQDFVRTARAKGALENTVIWKHMLRNALIPIVTTLGPALAGLLTGSIVIEQIFGVPGVGTDFIRSIGQRDYSMIMGTTVFYSALILLGNLSVDILYGAVDPRIRVE